MLGRGCWGEGTRVSELFFVFFFKKSKSKKKLLLLFFIFFLFYSRLSLSRRRRDPLKYFEISVLRHIRCAEMRKIPIKQPSFTNEHVI